VVLEGREGPVYAGIVEQSLVFTSDATRFAYVGKRNNKFVVNIDGKEQRGYDGIGRVRFSGDGRHVAYEATDGGKDFVVVDGQEGTRYHDIVDDTLTSSPNGSGVAYAYTQDDNTVVMIVDGRVFSPADEVLVGSPVFSPDGKSIAYGAFQDKRWFVIVNKMNTCASIGASALILTAWVTGAAERQSATPGTASLNAAVQDARRILEERQSQKYSSIGWRPKTFSEKEVTELGGRARDPCYAGPISSPASVAQRADRPRAEASSLYNVMVVNSGGFYFGPGFSEKIKPISLTP
jgi:WD40-like Beta Propeller Repeat